MLASALSAVLGFSREIVTAHFFGTQSEVDAFLNASIVPLVLFGVFNGSLVGSLVPIFSDYASVGRDDDVRRLGSTVINGLLIIMAILTIIGWLMAPLFVQIVAHGFPPQKQHLEVEMVRILMPGIIATTLSGVCTALLNANHRFSASALVTVATNIVTLIIVVTLHHLYGIFALVIGTVAGLFAQLLIQLPAIIQHRLYHFEIDLRHPGLTKAWSLFLPFTIGSGAWQINLAFDRYFASTLNAGSTAALGYTTKIVFLPIMIVATAIGTAIFPLIAGQFSANDRAAMRNSITLSLRMVGFIVLPCASGLIALAHPIVQTLFERGAFTSASTNICASLVPYGCVPLISISYNVILGKICFACKERRLAILTSFVVVSVNIALSAILLPHLGASALLLANGLAMYFGTAISLALVWQLSGGFDWPSIFVSLARATLAAALMGTLINWVASLGFFTDTAQASRPFSLVFLIGLGGLVYFTISSLLGSREGTSVFQTFAKGILRRTATSGDPAA
jgi:putative peptidoglycan lipid II flippase